MTILWRTVGAAMLFASRVRTQTPSTLPASATSSGTVPTHTVSVGAEPHKFTPNNLNASVGDIIEFIFYPLNHSVARAEFGDPCIPYEVTGPGKVGFWSGFRPVNLVLQNPPTFHVRINDTNPIFFYCGAPGACNHDGMVGAINTNSNQTFDEQLAMAKNASQAFVPGESFPAEGVPSTSALTPTTSPSSSTPTTMTVTQTTTPSATGSPGQPNSGFSTGAIVGISIGAAAIAVLAASLFYLCGRQRMFGEFVSRSQASQAALAVQPGPYSPYPNNLSPPPMSLFPDTTNRKVPSADISSPTAYAYNDSGTRGMGDMRYNNHSPANETSSYRSRSPPVNEAMEPAGPLFFPVPANRNTGTDWSNPPEWSGRESGAGQPRYSSGTGYDLVSPTSLNSQGIPNSLRPQMPPSAHVASPGPHELAVPHEGAWGSPRRLFSFSRSDK